MNTPAVTISVLIVNYNGRCHLEECLTSLRSQSFKDFETILVDNGSGDDSVPFIHSRFPEVKVIRSGQNLGFSGGNNLGLRHCLGKHVLFLNNDVRVDAHCLENLVLAVEHHPGTGVFQCLLVNYTRPDKVDSAGDCIYWNGCVFSFRDFPVSILKEDRPILSACGAAAFFERTILDQVGGFDEDFYLNFEDVDLSLRSRHFGHEVMLVPSAVVYHKGSATQGRKNSDLPLYYSERNSIFLFIKNFPLSSLFLMAMPFLVLKIYRFAVYARQGRTGLFFRANFDALKKMPVMIKKRHAILSQTHLSPGKFRRILRKGWLREALQAKKGIYRLLQ